MTTRNTKLQQFLSSATEEDLQKLADHINSAAKKKECLPAPDLGWDFSYSAIAPALEERGLLTRRHKSPRDASDDTPQDTSAPSNVDGTMTSTANTDIKPFVVHGDAPSEKISRSVQLDKDVSDRLRALESKCWQYTHSAVLNQLLRDALSIYGF